MQQSSTERWRKRGGETEQRNTSAGQDTGEGGGQKRINDFTAMFEKGKCMVSAEMWSDLQVPWCFPFMCRADYQVIFSGKNELTDALR